MNDNKIINGIAEMEALIARSSVSGETKAKLSKELDLSFKDFCEFQTLKSAFIGDKLTMEEAQTIYNLLGTAPEHFNKQPPPVKICLTHTFAMLLKSAILIKSNSLSPAEKKLNRYWLPNLRKILAQNS